MPIIFEINKKTVDNPVEYSRSEIKELIDKEKIITLLLSSPYYSDDTVCINTWDYKWFVVVNVSGDLKDIIKL